MFEARFAQAKIFKHLIDALGELGELGDLEHNFNLYCSNDGITIQDINIPGVVAVVRLNSADFDFFQCDKPMRLGVNFTSMKKTLSFAKNNDIITMKVGVDENSLSLVIEAIGKKKRRVNRTHYIKFDDIHSEQIDVHDLEFKCIISMPSEKLQRIIQDMEDLVFKQRLIIAKNMKKDDHNDDLDSVIMSCTREGLRLCLNGGVTERRRRRRGNVLIRHNDAPTKDEDKVIINMHEPDDDDDDYVKNNEIKESLQPAVLEQTQHVTQASRGSGSDLSETRKNNTLVGIEGMDKVVMEKQHPSASPPCRPPPAESGEPSIAAQVDVAVPAPPTTQRRTGKCRDFGVAGYS
jgi:proliferating cell nuclear antigen PCNA